MKEILDKKAIFYVKPSKWNYSKTIIKMIFYCLRYGYRGPQRYLQAMQRKYSDMREAYHNNLKLRGTYDNDKERKRTEPGTNKTNETMEKDEHRFI